MAKFSVMRFYHRTDKPLPHPVVLESTKATAFKDIKVPAEIMSAGFVAFGDMLDTEFDENAMFSGSFGLRGLGFRLDVRRPDRNLIKNSARLRVRAWQKAQDKQGGLPGVDPKSIPDIEVPEGVKADALDKAREEIVAKTQPSPSLSNVFWDYENKTVYLLTLAPATIKEFVRVWGDAYGGYLVPVDAHSMVQEDKQEDDLLGAKFLTWIWKSSTDEDGNVVSMSAGDDEDRFSVYIDRKMSVRQKDSDLVESMVFSGDLSDIKEAGQSVRDRRFVVGARLFVENNDGEKWEFGLRAVDFAVGGMKIPDQEADSENPEALWLDQFSLIREGLRYLDVLYAEFLRGLAEKEK